MRRLMLAVVALVACVGLVLGGCTKKEEPKTGGTTEAGKTESTPAGK